MFLDELNLLASFIKAEEKPLSESGKWTRNLAFDSYAGNIVGEAWAPESTSFLSGVHWTSELNFSEPAATVEVHKEGAETGKWHRVIACLNGASLSNYYAARFTRTAVGEYTVELEIVEEGKAKALGSAVTKVAVVAGDLIGIAIRNGVVTAWVKHAGSWSEVVKAANTKYSKGAVGFDAVDSTAFTLRNFSAASNELDGVLNAGAGGAGTLGLIVSMGGSAGVTSAASGNLGTIQSLSGADEAQASITGSLSLSQGLSAEANISVGATGNLSLGTPAPQTLTPLVSPAVANPFSYYAYDLLSGRFIGQVPLRGVSFGQQLNGAGQLTATLDLRDPQVRATGALACTIPNRTLIVADYDGAIMWAGIVLPRDWNVEATPQNTSGTLSIQCSEIWAYFGQRDQATDYSSPPYSGITGTAGMSLWTQTPWDASLIACQVLEDAIGYTNHMAMPYGDLLGGLGILLNGTTPAGTQPAAPAENWIAINYPYTSTQTVETIVNQLSQLGLGVGFDFGVDVAYSAGPASMPIATINLSYPRRGRVVEENHLMIDLTTARRYKFPEDGTQTANQVYEIGGSGAIVVDENIYPLEQGYPLWERVMSRSQIQSQHITNILGQIGVSDLAMYSYAPVTPTCILSSTDPNLPLGSFVVGDDVRIYLPELGSDGQVYDPRFPAGLDQEWRVTSWKASISDDGDATVEYTFTQPPYLQALAPAV